MTRLAIGSLGDGGLAEGIASDVARLPRGGGQCPSDPVRSRRRGARPCSFARAELVSAYAASSRRLSSAE